jgi:hypothetical protein
VKGGGRILACEAAVRQEDYDRLSQPLECVMVERQRGTGWVARSHSGSGGAEVTWRASSGLDR